MNKYIQLTFMFVAFCTLGLMAQPEGTTITNEQNMNTNEREYSPAFYEDGIIYVSTKVVSRQYRKLDMVIKEPTMSLYYSKKGDDGTLQQGNLLSKDLTTKFHEGPVSFDTNSNTLYFTRNNFTKGVRRSGSDGITKLKIYSSTKTGEGWSQEVELPFNNNEYGTAHPALSADGNTMIFSSNRPGGEGGMDLYVVSKSGGSWGEPQNLGPEVNTPKNEVFPTLHSNGILFYSSDGFGGETKKDLDIYYALGEGASWSAPVRMEGPFLSTRDDFGVMMAEDRMSGYFSTNRGGGRGRDDVYRFDMPIPFLEDVNCNVSFNVFDKATGQRIDDAIITYVADGVEEEMGTYAKDLDCANYTFKINRPGYGTGTAMFSPDENNGEPINVYLERELTTVNLDGTVFGGTSTTLAGAEVIITELTSGETKTISTGASGKFTFPLNCGGRYKITASKSGYTTATQEVSTSSSDCANKSKYNTVLTLAPVFTGDRLTITKGTILELPNIYYDYNKANIRADAAQDLDLVANLMTTYPDIEIELMAHTDSRGSDTYNEDLSQMRAERAMRYLEAKGISAGRMIATGYGERMLRNGCSDGTECSEEEHQRNRRTEVKITNMSDNYEVRYMDNPPRVIDRKY